MAPSTRDGDTYYLMTSSHAGGEVVREGGVGEGEALEDGLVDRPQQGLVRQGQLGSLHCEVGVKVADVAGRLDNGFERGLHFALLQPFPVNVLEEAVFPDGPGTAAGHAQTLFRLTFEQLCVENVNRVDTNKLMYRVQYNYVNDFQLQILSE